MNAIFFKLVFRNFFKSKLLNSLNLLGLALGLTSSLLIIFYADHELSFDRFHSDAKRIFRMEGQTNSDQWFSTLGMEHGRELISGRYPEIEAIVQLNQNAQTFISHDDRRFAEAGIYQTAPGSEFFQFFDFKILEGNRGKLLEAPNSVVITESIAQKYFGDTSPIGETLKRDSVNLQVTGVIADLPSNSHLQFDFLYTNPITYGQEHFHTNTYVRLVSAENVQKVERAILDMEGVARDEFHELTNVSLVAVPDIYFDSRAGFGAGGQGDSMQLTVFLVIGGLILLIAIANYMNLSLAIYSGKGLEVGMRKVLGETGKHINRKFFWESLLLTSLSIPLVVIGLVFLLPKFNDYMGLRIQNQLFENPVYGIALILFLAGLSALTVLYPASSLVPTNIGTLLKSGGATQANGGIRLRNILIFIQFLLLFTLGVSAWFMNRQVQFLDNKDMGFDASSVIKISNPFNLGGYEEYKLLKNKLLTSPAIAGVAFGPMMGDGMNPLAYKPEGSDEIFENLLSYGVDIDYFDVMGMTITAGDFKRVLLSSEDGQITSLVNESFIQRFGWEDDPIGKKLILRPGTENELNRTVSAVFKDFHFFTLKEKVTPQIISLRPDPSFVNTNILVRAAIPNMQVVLQEMQQAWEEIQPAIPMQFEFMNDAVRQLYARERQTGQVSLTFSLLALALSLVGLIGFMLYVIGLRSKEIAVRKVLGASLLQIITFLNRQLFWNILMAALIGSTISYWLVSSWLEDYAYTITIHPVTFIAALFLVYAVVFSITGVQSLKSAQSNPVAALKND